jgi:hypothetical protein
VNDPVPLTELEPAPVGLLVASEGRLDPKKLPLPLESNVPVPTLLAPVDPVLVVVPAPEVFLPLVVPIEPEAPNDEPVDDDESMVPGASNASGSESASNAPVPAPLSNGDEPVRRRRSVALVDSVVPNSESSDALDGLGENSSVTAPVAGTSSDTAPAVEVGAVDEPDVDTGPVTDPAVETEPAPAPRVAVGAVELPVMLVEPRTDPDVDTSPRTEPVVLNVAASPASIPEGLAAARSLGNMSGRAVPM